MTVPLCMRACVQELFFCDAPRIVAAVIVFQVMQVCLVCESVLLLRRWELYCTLLVGLFLGLLSTYVHGYKALAVPTRVDGVPGNPPSPE